MHPVEHRYLDIDVVVQVDVVLAFVGAEEPSDVLNDTSLEGQRKTRNSVSSSGQSNPSPR